MADGQRHLPPRTRKRRAWWQWVLGLAMLGLAGVSATLQILQNQAVEGREVIQPIPLKLAPGMVRANRVAAERGALRGFNVLVVTLDTTRADRLGCYGNPDIDTPNLDALAQNGILFTDAMAPGPTTLPSHSSIFTGQYPYHHGARNNGLFRLNEDATTLAEVLTAEGYDTAAAISAIVLESRFGLAQGFGAYFDDIDPSDRPSRLSVAERSAADTNARALDWVKQDRDRPFFLWVHYYDPHAPHDVPAELASRYPPDRAYDAEISYADAQLGKLLEALDDVGTLEQTFIVVAGDHGEGLGQHGERTHGCLLYNSTMQVPMIFSAPAKLPRSTYVDRSVGLIDIYPTVLSLLGAEADGPVDGVDLTQSPAPEPRALYFETLEGYLDFGWSPLLGVRVGDWKYIAGPQHELYALAKDWHEATDLLAAEPAIAERMTAALAAFFGDDFDRAVAAKPNMVLTQEDIARLQGLGYIMAGPVGEVASGSLPHPKDMLPLQDALDRIMGAEKEAGLDATVDAVEVFVKEHPEFPSGYTMLGRLMLDAGQFDEAEEAYKEALTRQPTMPGPLIGIAQVKERQGLLRESCDAYREVLRVCPDHVGAWIALGGLLVANGDFAEAGDVLLRAFDLAPHHAATSERLVLALTKSGRSDEAVAVLRRRLAERPDLAAVRNSLAMALSGRGEYGEAIDLLEQGYRNDPQAYRLANNLAAMLIMCPDKRYANPIRAVLIMEDVCTATAYRDPQFMFTLSNGYAALNRLDEAMGMIRRGKQIAEEHKNAALSAQFGALLAKCEATRKSGVAVTPITVLTPPEVAAGTAPDAGSNGN